MKPIAIILICGLVFQSLEAVPDWSRLRTINRVPSPPPLIRNLMFDMHRYAPDPMVRGTRDMRAEGCGIPNPAAADNARIVGGWETGVNEFPWQVGIFIDDLYFCGGTLLSEDWVLTAAQCVDRSRLLTLYLGAHNIREPEAFRLEIQATEYYVHPNWDSSTLDADVALIKLPQPVVFNDIIRPICLPAIDEAHSHVGEVVIASGWGRISDADVNLHPTLMKTNATVIANQLCSNTYMGIDDGNLCISTKDGHGTCNGDTGGPLSHIEKGQVFFEQIGIASFGSVFGCENGDPAGFTSVDFYLDWISSITNIMV